MKRILSYIFWTGSAIFAGIFFFNLLFQGGHLAYSKLKEVVIKTNTTSLSAETINHNIPIEVKKPPEITLAFVGDIMLDRGVESSVKKNLNNDFNRVFENVSFLKDYDILFGSLEGSASNEGANTGKKYSFRMDPLVLPAIKNAGFDILNLANNHADDWGRASFDASLINLE
ncbi:MAG: CapA family protein, partial [Candidatus Paceibacterota bacterium]